MRRVGYLVVFLLLDWPLATATPVLSHASSKAEGGVEGAPEPAQPASLNWQIEWVDAPKTFSNMGPRSLVLDASGHPHVAYGQDYLYYAWHDGSTWHLETVDASLAVGRYASLALDASGHPHISYFDAFNEDLKYAHFDGITWQVETVDSPWDVGGYTSLTLDAAGRPHISYYDWWHEDLKYAFFDGSAWQVETVDSTGFVGEYTSLALDASGRPHISYHDNTNDDLKYAWGSEWPYQVYLPVVFKNAP